jgi:excisionase family DNA binding protein
VFAEDTMNERRRLMQKALLKIEEAADLLSLGRSKVYELVAAGELPAIKVGRATRLPTESLRRWVDKQTAAVERAREANER